MIARDDGAILVAMGHVRKLLLHFSSREEGDVLESQGPKDILVAVVVQGQPGDTLERDASEVNVDTVLPSFSRLEQQWLQYILDVAGELVEPNWMRMVTQLLIKERITEAS